MKCPKCGQEAVGNFCSNCGTPLVNDTVRGEQETVGRKQENSYDDGDSEQRNPARMESDEKKAESGSGSKRNSQEKRSSQSQDAQKREEERRDNERCQSQAQEDARRDREAASRRRQDARRSSSSAKEDKRDAKQQKQMEKRLHALESERERSERQKNRMERSHQRELERQSREADGPSVLDVTAAGVTGVVVLMARVMQAASFLLMAGITWANAKAFRYGGDDLGYIGTMITEENYGLGLYVGIGVFLVLMGAIWCLWILSGKHAGGKVRLQKYDTGRGFIPFIIILVLVLVAGPAAYLMPKNAGSLQPIVDGGYAALEAINANHGFLLFCSIGGAILSFIRKMLLV